MQRYFCSQCGSQINETIRFCGECGKEVLTQSPVLTPEPVPKPTTPPQPPPMTAYTPPPAYRPAPAYAAPAVRKNNTPVIIAAIIGGTVVILAVLTVVLLVGLRGKSQPKAEDGVLVHTPIAQQNLPTVSEQPQSEVLLDPTLSDMAGWWQSEMTLYDLTAAQETEVVWVRMDIEVVPIDDVTANLILHPLEGREGGAAVDSSEFSGETETLTATFENGGLSMMLPYEQEVYLFMPIAPKSGSLFGSGEAYFGDEEFQAKVVMTMLKQ